MLAKRETGKLKPSWPGHAKDITLGVNIAECSPGDKYLKTSRDIENSNFNIQMRC